MPRPRISLKQPSHVARFCGAVLLLYSAHHHAEVTCFYDDSYTLWLQDFLERITDLLPEALLDLESASIHIHNPWDLTEANDLRIWNVADVHFPSEGEHVVLTERVTLDIFHDDHAVGVTFKQRSVDDGLQVLVIPRGEEFQGFVAALGGALQSLTLWIFADGLEQRAKEVVHGVDILPKTFKRAYLSTDLVLHLRHELGSSLVQYGVW